MTERYIVTSERGDPIIRTNSRPAAELALTILAGQIIDTEGDNS